MDPAKRGLVGCVVTGVLLGSAGTLALLLALVPSLRESALVSLQLSRRACRDDSGDKKKDGVVDGEKNRLQRRALPNASPDGSMGRSDTGGQQALMDSVDLPLRILSKAEGVVQYRSTLLVVIERCVNDFNYSAILRTAEALGVQDVWLVDPPPAAGTDHKAESLSGDVLLEDGQPETTNGEDHDGGGDNNSNAGEDDSTTGDAALLLPSSVPSPPQRSGPRGMTDQEREQRSAHHLFARKATSWLSLREFQTTAECLRELRNGSYQVWATDLSQRAVPLSRGSVPAELPSNGRIAVVFGTEAVGVSQEMLDGADLRVYLPLRGFADSLNLSVAAALVVQQVLQLYPGLVGNYPRKDELRRKWFAALASRRMWTPRQKKAHRKLQSHVADCQSYLRLQRRGLELTKEQLAKLERLPEWEAQMQEMEREVAQAALAAVDEHVRHPPPPLTDLRRADEHRVTFVGKNTKQRHQDHWVGMVATSNYRTQHLATARLFRNHQSAADDNCDEPNSHSAP